MSSPPERRRVQRVRLVQPLPATVDGVRAFVYDISLRGVRVMHQDEIGRVDSECVLRTEWEGFPIELSCAIVRTGRQKSTSGSSRPVLHTGLTITRAAGVSSIALRRLVLHHVERALDEQKANARGVPPPLAAQSLRTGGETAFVRHEYAGGRWREVMTTSAEQPEHGFTIAAQTPQSDVDMLRAAYERATPADAVIIKRLAALSVGSGEIVQARRYTP